MFLVRRFLINLILIFILIGCTSVNLLTNNKEPDIKDIVACNVYWEDYKYTSLKAPEAAKFVVTFDTDQRVDVSLIDSIVANGPDGYYEEFSITPFTLQNVSGYVDEVDNNFIWFQTYDGKGFLKNGKYTITLKYKSGKTSKKSRILNYTDELLRKYQNAKLTFSPKGQLSQSSINKLHLRWTVIPETEAYYATRLMKLVPEDPSSVIVPIMFDNIFGQGEGNQENTGLNKEHASVSTMLDPKLQYVWFTEILDSNNLNEINIAIFQPAQFFWFDS